jgi:hypothetical protein
MQEGVPPVHWHNKALLQAHFDYDVIQRIILPILGMNRGFHWKAVPSMETTSDFENLENEFSHYDTVILVGQKWGSPRCRLREHLMRSKGHVRSYKTNADFIEWYNDETGETLKEIRFLDKLVVESTKGLYVGTSAILIKVTHLKDSSYPMECYCCHGN